MIPYAAGDWFAVPLRFGLFAVGRAAAVDSNGMILGYFFARFFERVPDGTEVLALTPGEADLIAVCDRRSLRNGEWPRIAPAGTRDVRRWTIPVFRTIEPASGEMRWFTYEPANLSRPVAFEREPREAGVRNWGLSMLALEPTRMSPEMVEFALWQRFRDFQNRLHRKYIADMQGSALPNPWRSALATEPQRQHSQSRSPEK